MRLSVDGFASLLLSRKTLFATAGAGAVALIALGAFTWKGGAGPVAPHRPTRSSARRAWRRSTSARTCTA